MNIADLLVVFASSPTYVGLTLLTLSAAVVVLLLSKKTSLSVSTRVFLIYAHLALLLVPVALFAYASGCAMPFVDCTVKTALYAAPFILLGIIAVAGVVGYFALPRLYGRNALKLSDPHLSRFMRHHAKKQGMKTPQLFLVDSRAPMAFSFSSLKPSIYVSAGMMDLLNKQELEAVLLHELGHVQHKSSLLKFSSSLLHWLSPVAHFGKNTVVAEEESVADAFAITAQGTDEFLTAAYQKVRSCEK